MQKERSHPSNNRMRWAMIVAFAFLAAIIETGTAQAVMVQLGPHCVTAPATPGAQVCVFTGATGTVCVPIAPAMQEAKYCATVKCDVDGSATVSEGAADIPASCEVAETIAFSGTATCTVKVTKNKSTLWSQTIGPVLIGPGVSPIEVCVDVQY